MCGRTVTKSTVYEVMCLDLDCGTNLTFSFVGQTPLLKFDRGPKVWDGKQF